MEPIDEQHMVQPGLVILDITAADEATALAAVAELDRLWATSGIGVVRRVPGGLGVKARLYAHLRRCPAAPPRGDDAVPYAALLGAYWLEQGREDPDVAMREGG
ncbi:DUF6207 family protein [Streptomyces sp. V4I2]|uniref:DUF6207 family protein n=1 Tax=Streptomyces sp. V4I2 TaxID=3042280 RepID=UPI0027865AA0|nr:DUF6207 family protein [Streptomyces sp. V4I2]MDQ1051582.1 hypothetical protein [Streptomyces sp. V4I2]